MGIWWQARSEDFLNDVLSKINSSHERENPVDKALDLFLSLNRTWTEYNRSTSSAGASDNDSLKRLLFSLDQEGRSILVKGDELRSLIGLLPQVMNHHTLRKHDYDPENIPAELEKKAQDEHRQLTNAFSDWEREPSGQNQERVIKKLAQILLIIRSNIAHGEKTLKSPDRLKKERDRIVCKTTAPLVGLILELVYDHPKTKLAVYGTLIPGGSNQSLLERITGVWREAFVRGYLKQEKLSYFSWDASGDSVPVKLFVSQDLPNLLSEIDEFEGEEYDRILLPIRIGATKALTVGQIYEDHR